MKICYICSRYADPDPANRRRNLAEARALARWAEAQGYAVVTWWGSIEPTDPPCDSDDAVRRDALARSAALAAMVGKAGGDIVGPHPSWYEMTPGMYRDYHRWQDEGNPNGDEVIVPWSEVEPYYTAPEDPCANAPKCPIKNRRIVMNKDPYMLKIIDEFGSFKKVPEVTNE